MNALTPATPSHQRNELTAQAQQASRALGRPQKAAIIIALLGPESAGPIVENMDDRHLKNFVTALGNLQQVPREVMLSTVADFLTDLKAESSGFRGGAGAAKELAQTLFDSDRAARLFSDIPVAVVNDNETHSDVWSQLTLKKTNDIVRYLAAQRPEVVSVVLAQISADKAGEILAELPEDMSIVCVDILSRKQEIDVQTIAAIADVIKVEFLTQSQVDEGGQAISLVSEILSILPKGRRDTVMEKLKKTDPERAKKIEQGMMTFEDLPTRLPSTAIPILFRDFDQDLLIKALKAGKDLEPKTTEFLFANISQRMAEQYKEQVEEMGALTQKEADGSITALMGFIGKLEKEGRITLIKPAPVETA